MFPKDCGARILGLAINNAHSDPMKRVYARNLLSPDNPDAEREFVEVAFKMAQSAITRFQDELKWVHDQMKNKESKDA